MLLTKTVCRAWKSSAYMKGQWQTGGHMSKDGLFCHISAVTQSNIDWSLNNLVQMFSCILIVKVTTRGQKSCNDKKIGFLTFDLWFWPWPLTHSILAPTIGVGKNMLWKPSAAYRRRAFRYIRTSVFYTFPVFDHFIGLNLYPVNW